MNPQLQLSFDAGSIQERFEQFHAENPDVYTSLVRLALLARSRGATRVGIGQLFEVLRWDTSIRTRSWDGLKLNNSFRSRYVREIQLRESADIAEMFETRELRAP